jgi:hypothetical protein
LVKIVAKVETWKNSQNQKAKKKAANAKS